MQSALYPTLQRTLRFSVSSGDDVVARTGNTTQILFLGDSNIATGRITAPDTDVNVKAWQDSTATLVTAQDPLEYISWTGLTSAAVFLGKSLSNSTGNDVVVVPAAQGGSGFQTTDWEAGGTLYLEAVQRFNDAYAAATNVTEILIVISIGANNIGTASYAADLDSLVTRLRADLTGASSTTPAQLINLNKDYVTTFGREGIEALGADLSNRVAYTNVIDMATVRSNADVIESPNAGFDDETHHYDQDKIASLLRSGINTAKANTTAVGTQAVPQFFLTPTIVDNSDGTINIRVPYNAFYNPQPTSQRIDVYKADDASFTNETLVSQNSVSVGTTSYTYTLPAIDDKHYYGKFVGINANGSNEFRTSDTFLNDTITNTVAPVASGLVIVGQQLSVTNGSWDRPVAAYSYQWQKDSVDISGATSNTYTVLIDDEGSDIRCVVTADGVSANSNALSNYYFGDTTTEMLLDPADSSTYTLNGSDRISEIRDRNGGSFLMSQTNANVQPDPSAETVNGVRVLSFDGTEHLQQLSYDTPASGDISIFIAARVDTSDNGFDAIVAMDATNNDFQLQSGVVSEFRATVNNSLTGAPNNYLGEFRLFNLSFSNTNNLATLYVDGVLVDSETMTGAIASNVIFVWFANRARNQRPSGVSGFLMGVEAPTTDTREKIEWYTAKRYGLSLPSGHTYENTIPA